MCFVCVPLYISSQHSVYFWHYAQILASRKRVSSKEVLWILAFTALIETLLLLIILFLLITLWFTLNLKIVDNLVVNVLDTSSRSSLKQHTKPISFNSQRNFASEAEAVVQEEDPKIINDKEKIVGPADRHEFQTETAELLNIVAKSLYSENEVCK